LPITAPEKRPLAEIENLLKDARAKPIHEIPAFRRQLRLARVPNPIRALIYYLAMNWSGKRRARHLGTFGMSVVAGMGTATLTTLVPWTSMIHYTPFDETGSMHLRLIIDHRVLDGVELSVALRKMEDALNGPILDEVLQRSSALAA